MAITLSLNASHDGQYNDSISVAGLLLHVSIFNSNKCTGLKIYLKDKWMSKLFIMQVAAI